MTLSTYEESWWLRVNSVKGISPIDHLYNRLDGMYPGKFRSMFGNDVAVQNWRDAWAEAFDAERITGEDIAKGLRECRTRYDWPPSLTEFIKACRPPMDAETAYHEAAKGMRERSSGKIGEWSHPAIFWAAVQITAFDLLNQSYQQLEKRWGKALSDEMAKGNWAAIPEPAQALPAPGKTLISQEEASKRLNELQANDVFKTVAQKRDHKLWARKIMQRHAEGDKTLSSIQIQFAREALKNETSISA